MDPEKPTDTADRDWARLVLIAGCVVAAVTAALVAPTIVSDGIEGSPIDSVLPGEPFETQDGQGAGAGGSGFGALNPGDNTGVGGETGLDRDTFASNDTEVHFVVESSRSTYWRTGTYGVYTGTGWERDVDTEPYRGSTQYDSLAGDRIAYDVELEKAASALPTAWRPTVVDGIDNLAVTETGSVLARDGVGAGTTFSGISWQPDRHVDTLRDASGPYPESVREQYTQLPDTTPARVGEFTSQLTAEDDTAYDAAKSIQSWLRSEKSYSLQASRQSETIADTFIFEMEQGYCEYFATAMTTMLRTQGIPARYTVGYTSGQEVGDNRYEVRGMNAHAWVEVYFPEVGWVRFDPTPGDSRLRAQQELIENELPDTEYEPTEAGSPGEEFAPGEIRNLTDDSGDGSGSGVSVGVYDVSFNRTVVPGVDVEVTVTRDGRPVPERTVLFNDESIGVTGTDGTVTGSVPESEQVRIEIGEPERSGSVGWFGRPDTLSAPADASGRLSGVVQTNETVIDAETEATVSVRGDRFPGSEVTVVATVQGITIPDATVSLDGERVGVTDRRGEAVVTLPDEPGNSTIAVERGPIAGETDLRVQNVELGIDPGLVALPFTSATVEVTADDEAIAGAPVVVDGETVSRTGPDGTATVSLPLAESVTVTTTQGAVTREATVDGLVRNALGVLVAVGLVIGLPIVVAYRRGYHLRDVGGGLRAIVAYSRRAVGAVAGRAGGVVRAAATRVSRTLVSLAALGAGERSLAELRESFGHWLGDKRRSLATLTRRERAPEQGSGDVNPADVPTIRNAWSRFLATLDVADPETHTPGELATHAIEKGHPREPVETLRDAFRDVEYGDREPSHGAERVREAIRAIEQETGGEPGEWPVTGAGDGVPEVTERIDRPTARGED